MGYRNQFPSKDYWRSYSKQYCIWKKISGNLSRGDIVRIRKKPEGYIYLGIEKITRDLQFLRYNYYYWFYPDDKFEVIGHLVKKRRKKK